MSGQLTKADYCDDLTKVNYPDNFIQWAKKKLDEDGEYFRQRAKFGPPLIKRGAQMVLIAAGEGVCEGKL